MDHVGGYLKEMDLEFVDILNVDAELIEQVRKWRNSKQVNQYMYTNHEISKEEHRRWIENLKNKKNAKAWIIKYNKIPVGLAQLSDIDYNNKIAEWGFYIADETVRGKGIGSSSLYKLIEYVFGKMKFNKMKTIVLENNSVAMNLYKRFGFEKKGKLGEKLQRDAEKIDVYLMILSRKKWEGIKKNI
jgi:UDP-4-amino-4,6-dideoxy-N-acetyl-beta-L-altrosamine N-acetyltransferase